MKSLLKCPCTWLVLALLTVALASFTMLDRSVLTSPQASAGASDALAFFARDWRDDHVWYQGEAEIAMYQASRNIYGEPRAYAAKFMVNKEQLDLEHMTKSSQSEGPEVFKFHVREDIPTQKYAYHYSTMCYVLTDSLHSVKLDMGSQEDCGASMKRMERWGDELQWTQYSYFPDQGLKEGSFTPPADVVLFEALPIVLRGYPFEQPEAMALNVLSPQRTTQHSPVQIDQYEINFVGKQAVQVPMGRLEAYHLQLIHKADNPREPVELWFAADPDLYHILVQYNDPSQQQTYAIQSVVWDAYWVR